MKIETILFDWGGTLAQVVRQEEALRMGARCAVERLGRPADQGALDDLLHRVLTMEADAAAHPELREADLSAVLSGWAQAQTEQVPQDWLPTAVSAIERAWIGALDPLPGALEAVRELRSRGHRMGLVSNCMLPPACCRQELTRQGFDVLLDFAVFSSAVGYRKPSPLIYEAALREVFPDGRPADLSRVLFVGDSPMFDVVAPARMGMRTALVKCQRGIWPAADYEQARPDLKIEAVAELPARLHQ
ncbi:MAG: hypothetical protein AMXMBFR13_29660 [Phycisphaerae bacterium]